MHAAKACFELLPNDVYLHLHVSKLFCLAGVFGKNHLSSHELPGNMPGKNHLSSLEFFTNGDHSILSACLCCVFRYLQTSIQCLSSRGLISTALPPMRTQPHATASSLPPLMLGVKLSANPEPHALLQVFLTRDYLAISMEFAQGGDLFAYTLGPNSYGKLAEVQARWIFQQLMLGLDYCHRKVGSFPLRFPPE